MARTDYGPEIKGSMQKQAPPRGKKPPPRESSADKARDIKAGIAEGSPRDMRLDAMPQNQAPSGAPDAHHVAMATSIAHAILNRGRGG